MKKSLWIAVVAALVGAVFVAESAQAARHDKRQRRQKARVAQGVKSGELTHGEVRRIEAQQNRVRNAERVAEKDGVVTDSKKARIERMQDRASAQIHRLKHNARKRVEGKPVSGDVTQPPSGDAAPAPESAPAPQAQ